MLGKLKSLFTRRPNRDYNLTAAQRHEADMLRDRGPEGERELIVEHQAERRLDDEEGRPRED